MRLIRWWLNRHPRPWLVTESVMRPSGDGTLRPSLPTFKYRFRTPRSADRFIRLRRTLFSGIFNYDVRYVHTHAKP